MSVRCYACDSPIHATEEFIANRQADGKAFYCLNGHGNVFKGPTPDQRRIASLEQSLRFANERATSEARRHQITKRRLAAARGQITKLRKRIEVKS